jgi:hypothetical protein
LIFNDVNGAALAGSMDVTRTETFFTLLVMSSPTVVGVLGAFTPEDHDDTIAAITTVIATIRITPITGDTPSSFFCDLFFLVCINMLL